MSRSIKRNLYFDFNSNTRSIKETREQYLRSTRRNSKLKRQEAERGRALKESFDG